MSALFCAFFLHPLNPLKLEVGFQPQTSFRGVQKGAETLPFALTRHYILSWILVCRPAPAVTYGVNANGPAHVCPLPQCQPTDPTRPPTCSYEIPSSGARFNWGKILMKILVKILTNLLSKSYHEKFNDSDKITSWYISPLQIGLP